MKVPTRNTKRSRHRESGSAVLLVLAVLAILMIFFGVEFATLRTFRRELKLINQRQVRRLERVHSQAAPAATGTQPAERDKSLPKQ